MCETPLPLLAMPETYTTLQAATALGVHVNTVRQWINEFADVLSAGARQRPRVLTAGDMATLHHVAQLRADDKSRAEILAMLREMPTADRQAQVIDSAVMQEESPSPATSSPLAPVVDTSALLVDLATLVDTRTTAVSTQVQQLSDRVAVLESRRLLYTGIAIGIAAGVLLGVVLARLLLLR